MLLAVRNRVVDALGKFGEHSKSKSYSRLRLELLLRIFRALQTSCVHPELDIRTLSVNKFLNSVCDILISSPDNIDLKSG